MLHDPKGKSDGHPIHPSSCIKVWSPPPRVTRTLPRWSSWNHNWSTQVCSKSGLAVVFVKNIGCECQFPEERVLISRCHVNFQDLGPKKSSQFIPRNWHITVFNTGLIYEITIISIFRTRNSLVSLQWFSDLSSRATWVELDVGDLKSMACHEDPFCMAHHGLAFEIINPPTFMVWSSGTFWYSTRWLNNRALKQKWYKGGAWWCIFCSNGPLMHW
jgi:hypothetical protein